MGERAVAYRVDGLARATSVGAFIPAAENKVPCVPKDKKETAESIEKGVRCQQDRKGESCLDFSVTGIDRVQGTAASHDCAG